MDLIKGPPKTPLLNNNNLPLKTPSGSEGHAFTFDETKKPTKSDGGNPPAKHLNEKLMSHADENEAKSQVPAWSHDDLKSPLPDLKLSDVQDIKQALNWPTSDSTWAVHGNSRQMSSVDDFWKEVPPPSHCSLPYPPLAESLSHLHQPIQNLEYPFTGLGQMYTPPPLGIGYGSNLQHWRETGYPIGGGGFWRRGPGPYPDNGAMSRESSRDDLTSMGEQIFDFEDRFRVDRRKLELMIIGRFDPVKEAASDFFQRIGDETNTTVIWPSRIKIGAKSKKDPHIRVGGICEDSVRKAKAMIMEYLDTKTSRVTMKMDVSYTDHSHVIGKGGNTIRRVMTETNCHVHFPDSNRSNPNEKSNQVSIAGEMDGVENARARVRELTPLIFCFDLPIIPTFEQSPDPNDPCVRTIQDQYNIQVTFRQKQKNFHTTIVVVKGCEWEASRVKEATLLLIEHFYCNNPNPTGSGGTGGPASNILVSMNMEISPIHHGVVLGKGNINLRTIMQKTKTTVLFPDASDPNIPSIRKGSVTITGNINNVYLTRQLLVGSLPLVMMFDLPDHIEVEDSTVQKIQEELDVAISIKPKQRQTNKSVMIKAQERNASGMYKARHQILGLDGEPIKADIPETYKLQTAANQFVNSQADSMTGQRQTSPTPCVNSAPGFLPFQNLSPYSLQNFANLHAAAGLGGLAGLGTPGLQNFLFPPASPTLFTTPTKSAATPIAMPCYDQLAALNPYLSGIPVGNPWISPIGGFGNILPPNHPYLQDYALRVLNHITHLQQLETQQNKSGKEEALDASVNTYLPVDDSPPIKGTSPRNSSPVHDNIGNLTNQFADIGNLTNQFTKIESNDSGMFFDMNQNSAGNVGMLRSSTAPTNSSSGTSTASNSSGHSLPNKMANGSSPTCSFTDSCNNNNGTKVISDLGQMFIEQLTDRRAPGCEKSLQIAQTKMDYDQKKLLATKAIQTKPTGEPRTPTTSWSGLGFSNSMPESVIRENLTDLESTDGGPGANGKRPNLALFPSLMNVREETDEEVAKSNEKSPFSPAQTSVSSKASAGDGITSPTISAGQHFFRPGWFGNSSAFDVMLNPTSLDSDPINRILPSDDLPSLFARQGLAKYTDVFLRHEVDLATFATLTEQDLKEIGIQTFGARKKLLLLANKVKQAGSHRW